MAWRQISIAVGADFSEGIEQRLLELGALSVSLEDAGDQALLEPAPGETPLWDRVRLCALFDEDVDCSAINVALSPTTGQQTIAWEYVADRAWERVWLDDFEAMSFGESLWVGPHGQQPSTPRAAVIHLDPGLAFGTGRHATTALCLEWLASATLAGRVVIDYGCGSGLLAIAAVSLGAHRAIAVDIDEQALIATRANAQANGVGDRIEACFATTELPVADVVVANILASTLAELADRLAGSVRRGGEIVLSGILDEQAAETAALYSRWFEMNPPALRAGWARLTGRRK